MADMERPLDRIPPLLLAALLTSRPARERRDAPAQVRRAERPLRCQAAVPCSELQCQRRAGCGWPPRDARALQRACLKLCPAAMAQHAPRAPARAWPPAAARAVTRLVCAQPQAAPASGGSAGRRRPKRPRVSLRSLHSDDDAVPVPDERVRVLCTLPAPLSPVCAHGDDEAGAAPPDEAGAAAPDEAGAAAPNQADAAMLDEVDAAPPDAPNAAAPDEDGAAAPDEADAAMLDEVDATPLDEADAAMLDEGDAAPPDEADPAPPDEADAAPPDEAGAAMPDEADAAPPDARAPMPAAPSTRAVAAPPGAAWAGGARARQAAWTEPAIYARQPPGACRQLSS